jgi:hypothetical protein
MYIFPSVILFKRWFERGEFPHSNNGARLEGNQTGAALCSPRPPARGENENQVELVLENKLSNKLLALQHFKPVFANR